MIFLADIIKEYRAVIEYLYDYGDVIILVYKTFINIHEFARNTWTIKFRNIERYVNGSGGVGK